MNKQNNLKHLVLAVIILVMLNNIEHLATVHYTLAVKAFPVLQFDWLNKLHSILSVIIFELVIITMVMQGRHGFAGFFSFCIWILSQIYYKAFDLLLQGRYAEALAATIYSTVFTISIYMFSKMMAEQFEAEATDAKLRNRIYELEAKLKESEAARSSTQSALEQLQAELQQLRSDAKKQSEELKQLQQEKQLAMKDLQCPYCLEQQPSYGSLIAHKGHCSSKGKRKSIPEAPAASQPKGRYKGIGTLLND